MSNNHVRAYEDRTGEKLPLLTTIAEPQDHLGLDAADFLLLAEGHLMKAIQTLCQTEAESLTAYMAGEAITRAVASTREARQLLNEKEEPCKP